MPHHTQNQSKPHKDRRDWHNLRAMLPFIWEYRARALFALACLVLAKIANVGIPVLLKQIVDNLDRVQELLVVPVALLLAYGLMLVMLGALGLLVALRGETADVLLERVRELEDRIG